MKTAENLVLIVLTFFICSLCVASATQFYDLSYPFNNKTIYFPGMLQFALHRDYGPPQFKFIANSFCMGEHGGTHMDAPYHFNPEDGWTIDQIPPSRLFDVPAVLIDVRNNVGDNRDYLVEVHDLVDHEHRNGIIPPGSVVIFYTGWSRFWPDKAKYLGNANLTGLSSVLHFPGISLATAKWLATERYIIGVGIDTPSPDVGISKTYPVHFYLTKLQVYIIENVAHLDLLTTNAAASGRCDLRLFVVPLLITGGSGGPTRLLAYCQQQYPPIHSLHY